MEKDNNKSAEQEKLITELEELRCLVEKTLKEEAEKAEKNTDISEDMLIQDLNDTEPTQEKKDEPMCYVCEKPLSKKEIASGREYCSVCYEKMRRRPLKMKGILTALIMVVVFFGAAYTSMDSVIDSADPESEGYQYFFEGYVDYRDNRLISSEANYSRYLAEKQFHANISETAVRQYIDTLYTLGEYTNAVRVIEQYYSDFELSMPWNNRFRNIIEKNDAFYQAYIEMQNILEANYSENGLDYEKTVSDFYALKDKCDSKAEYLIDINAFNYSIYNEKDNGVIYKKLLELDDRYGKTENGHIPMLCRYAAMMGDKEVVDDCFNRMMKINCQDISIYAACFNYYRFLETPDAEKMLELCRRMSELSGELAADGYYNCDYLYYLAITYMVKGDAGESSFKMMQELYDTVNYYGASYSGSFRGLSGAKKLFNLYALTALYTGNTEAYEWAKTQAEYLGYEMSDIVEKYKNGEMTLAEVIADKGGDIA